MFDWFDIFSYQELIMISMKEQIITIITIKSSTGVCITIYLFVKMLSLTP